MIRSALSGVIELGWLLEEAESQTQEDRSCAQGRWRPADLKSLPALQATGKPARSSLGLVCP